MLSKEQTIGLFFLGALLLFGLAVEVTVGTRFLRPGYTLWAVFHDVAGLDSGATVRVGGVKAGTVHSIVAEKGSVRVEMTIGEGVTVYRGAVARLDALGLGGQRFVSISLGEPQKGEHGDGDTVESEDPVTFEQLLQQVHSAAGSVDELAQSFDRNSGDLLEAMSALVAENRAALARSLENLASITAKIDGGTGTLGKLVNDEALYQELAGSAQALRQSLDDIGAVAARLERGEGTLGMLIADDNLYREAEATVASLRSTADQFERMSASLEAGQGTLGRLLTDDKLYLDAQDAVRDVRRATQNVEDQAPLSILGTFASSLF